MVPGKENLYVYKIEVELFLAEDVAESDKVEWKVEAACQEKQ